MVDEDINTLAALMKQLEGAKSAKERLAIYAEMNRHIIVGRRRTEAKLAELLEEQRSAKKK